MHSLHRGECRYFAPNSPQLMRAGAVGQSDSPTTHGGLSHGPEQGSRGCSGRAPTSEPSNTSPHPPHLMTDGTGLLPCGSSSNSGPMVVKVLTCIGVQELETCILNGCRRCMCGHLSPPAHQFYMDRPARPTIYNGDPCTIMNSAPIRLR